MHTHTHTYIEGISWTQSLINFEFSYHNFGLHFHSTNSSTIHFFGWRSFNKVTAVEATGLVRLVVMGQPGEGRKEKKNVSGKINEKRKKKRNTFLNSPYFIIIILILIKNNKEV